MIYILNGDIRTGKTTAIMNWVRDRKDVGGFATPDESGKRILINLFTGEKKKLESKSENNDEVIKVGKFSFLRKTFLSAQNFTLDHLNEEEIKVIVIDEIGKLEMENKGFHALLSKILRMDLKKPVLLVVRNSLLDKVIKKYHLKNAVLIDKEELDHIQLYV